jgi:Fe2+ transport system protein FeoA
VERLAELFVEALTRVLAWVDAHKASLLAAAVAAGLIALSAAVNLWGLIELGALAHAASLMPFAALGGVEYSREDALKLLKGAPDPYKKFLEVAREANAGRIGLAEPWESLRRLIAPRPSEERRLVSGKAYGELDERGKRALFYAVLALEEALGVYRAASRRAGRLEEAVRKEEVGEPPLKRAVYVPDLGRLERLAEEEDAFEKALRVLRERLNEYAVKHDLRNLLDVKENTARELAEAEHREFSKYSGVSFGVKAYAALMAYREGALGRRGAYGTAAKYWLEEGGSARLLYYAPITAYVKAKKARAERPAAVEGMVAEALRRLFLRPGADRYSRFVEELTKGGKLALELEREAEKSLVFRLFRLEEGGNPVELEGVRLRIEKVGEGEGVGRAYFLELDVRWRELFEHELKMVEKAAEELRDRWPVEDPLPYMLGWSASDVSIGGGKNERELRMSSSHLWQVAETKVLFGWSDAVGLRMSLTLEGPKLQLYVHAPLSRLDGAIKRSAGLAVGRSAEGGWLSKLGVEAGSWDGLKRQVAERWRGVVDVAVRHLGEEARSELEELRDKLNDDKIAREAVAPALLLIQAEKLGVDGESLRYFAMVISGAVGGDGYVSAAGRGEVGLASGERGIALLWGAALAAYGIRAEVRGAGKGFQVAASGGDAVRLARLYLLFGPPLLEGRDDRLKNNKLAEAVKLGAKEALNVGWRELRRTKSGIAADLIISEGGVEVKFNAYLRKDDILLQFQSTDRGRVELAARLLKLAGVDAEMRREDGKGEWYVRATTDRLAAGREELRGVLADIVREALAKGWVDAGKAERWLDKLRSGITLREGWPKYHVGLNEGALEVRYRSTNPHNIEREARRLRDMGLVEGRHFAVKKPEGGGEGYVSILREGLERAAWLSVHGSGDRQRLAAEFVGYILERAREEGDAVYEKALKVVERGREVGSLSLADVRGAEVDVGGRRHVVDVLGGGARFEEGRSGRTLLRITIIAEVDGVRRDYIMTFGRYGRNNAAVGYAVARADAPGGREADAERLSALIKALTGREPRIRRMKDGTIIIECGREHLEGLTRYAELADAIAKWLEETGRQQGAG